MAQNVKTVQGVAIASVKTVQGTAIASVKTILGVDNTAGGGGFSPSDVTGLKLWFKADDGPDDPVDGQPVTTWTDKSSSGLNATGSSTARPIYKTSIINGKPVVRFDGSNDILETAALDLSATDKVTVFVVASASAGSNGVFLEMSTTIDSQTDSFLLWRPASNKGAVALRGNIGVSDWTTTSNLTTTPFRLTGFYDKSLSSGEAYAHVNGSLDGSIGNNSNNSGNFGNRAIYIGSRFGAVAPLAGDIAEIIVYSGIISGADLTAINSYLSTKYGF